MWGDVMGKASSRRSAQAVGRKNRRQRTGRFYYDYSLLAVIVLLTCFGLAMLYSSSFYVATRDFENDMHYFVKQAIISGICIIGAVGVSQFDYHILGNVTVILYIASILLMCLVQTPLGFEANGARRWIKLGPVQIQPAEVAKIAVILCMSYCIKMIGTKIVTLKASLFLLAVGGLQAAVAFLFTENLSTAIIIFGITFGMLFVAHPKIKPFLIFVLVVLVAGVVIIGLVYMLVDPVKNENFRLQRILVWLRPEEFASNEGYQILQGLYAIGSGGLFGRGLGNSIQKLGTVPEAQNDMIFSIICEELGIIGGFIVLFMFVYLLFRLFVIAQNAPDTTGMLMVSGIFIHIGLQVIMNIAVVTNLMPNTGVTLPFISYGGTSILFLMSEMGLALSVSNQIQLKDSVE